MMHGLPGSGYIYRHTTQPRCLQVLLRYRIPLLPPIVDLSLPTVLSPILLILLILPLSPDLLGFDIQVVRASNFRNCPKKSQPLISSS